jgi:ABC-type proline/glycine betaine transport system permease subunit
VGRYFAADLLKHLGKTKRFVPRITCKIQDNGFLTVLIGIIIASVVNLFVRNSGMSMIISYIGVLVFVGLTGYDTQKLKTMALLLGY